MEQIIDCNRIDEGKSPAEREPIRLYINSPGGDVTEGFALISAMELSKTPIHTINMGQWSSMAFLIGIAGHKRFSLPKASFLMHDGSIFLYGSANKVKDRIEFENRAGVEIKWAWTAEGILAPGETITGTATYKITQADVDAGSIKNVIIMNAKDPGNNPLDPQEAEVITELDAIF